ncbi:hypothetical protein [Roseibium litorale]|uniref:Baseplate J-like protein n=1 Tax=Roseibium litorale TaxID=2803841 RepID=A0ABR9CT88_9HYPH|nr:hypothetical protein [Roseibium litorale]MBD8894067.1 hypothetical protein [Roseibium litorale]
MQYVSYPSDDANFADTLATIKQRMDRRLKGADDLCNPLLSPFLQREDLDKLICNSAEALDFSALVFGFKGGPDPAGLYPLQSLSASTQTGRIYHVGSAIPVPKALATQILPFNNMANFKAVTTYYARAAIAQSDKDLRYKRRLVAFFIEYTTELGQARNLIICSDKTKFATIDVINKSADEVKAACLAIVSEYNQKNKDYIIDYEVNDVSLNFYPLSPDKKTEISNISYREVSGQSNQYISNLGLVSTVKLSSSDLVPDEGVQAISFQIPYSPNFSGQDLAIEMEDSSLWSYRSLVASVKKSDFSVAIPSFTLTAASSASVAIGQIAGYTYSNSRSQEVENKKEKNSKKTFKITIGAGGYVADTLLQSGSFELSSTITLLGAQDKEIVTLSVPLSVPGFGATNENDLVQAVLETI